MSVYAAWRRARLAGGVGADRLDAHGCPWTPVDRCGQLVEAAGVERRISKTLIDNNLRLLLLRSVPPDVPPRSVRYFAPAGTGRQRLEPSRLPRQLLALGRG